MADQVMTPEFRVSFPNVFRPGKSMEEGKEPKYNCCMLFEPGADLKPLLKACNDLLVEKFGADRTK